MSQSDQLPETREHVPEVYASHPLFEFHAGGPVYDAGVHSPAFTFRYVVLKRAMDFALVLVTLPLLLLIGGLTALTVTLTSPGPIFFSHRRVGKGGNLFSMWKFRTMYQNSAEVLEQHLSLMPQAREEWDRTRTLKNDPRVTAVGRFLRRSSLDELPQIWNVLTGRMSLVGPRPIVASEVQRYGSQLPYYIAVKPGITGLWQATRETNPSFDDRVALDRYYVEQWSLWLDVKVLALTLKTVWYSHEEAY